jgi:hypothetical protein
MAVKADGFAAVLVQSVSEPAALSAAACMFRSLGAPHAWAAPPARRRSRPDEEWQQFQHRVRQLSWRLEEAGATPGATVVHSDEAVDPTQP